MESSDSAPSASYIRELSKTYHSKLIYQERLRRNIFDYNQVISSTIRAVEQTEDPTSGFGDIVIELKQPFAN